jgi:xanthine/CO dehydrogenase XdhC/CoxF family maturation factor
MKDIKAIIEAFGKTDLSKRKAALATVVRVRGSSYRSPGARMLITDDGRWVGSISGGCLEGDALRKARQVMTGRKAVTVTYDTREESNQNLGIGLGCNGVIDVLIEPVEAENPFSVIQLFGGLVETEKPLAMATLFEGIGPVGRKLLISEEKTIFNDLEEADAEVLRGDLKRIFTAKKSEVKTVGANEFFLELIQPSIRVILFGGGFDARPLSQLAKTIGWNVEVTDECVAHIAPVFFPEADKLSLCQRQFIDRDFQITPYTACVLISHNYEYDRDVLKKLLTTPAAYIGILGPRKRFDKMREEFAKDGLEITEEDLQRIHSPAGLDIGAEAADEIAVSIVSEIQAKFAHREGGFLKNRNAPIHSRALSGDLVHKDY